MVSVVTAQQSFTQPQTVHKWMNMAVFQHHFIYSDRPKARFGLQVVICWTMAYSVKRKLIMKDRDAVLHVIQRQNF